MRLKRHTLICSIVSSLLAFNAHAICIKNETDFSLYYEIQNKNTGCRVPKVKFYSGIVPSHQKKCHDHSKEEGDDWSIYRFDEVRAYRIMPDGKQLPACRKSIQGILNFLEVDYHAWSDTWWCLDKSDYED